MVAQNRSGRREVVVVVVVIVVFVLVDGGPQVVVDMSLYVDCTHQYLTQLSFAWRRRPDLSRAVLSAQDSRRTA